MVMNAYAIPGLMNDKESIISYCFGINKDDLLKRTRKREIVEARHFLFWYSRKKEKGSWSDIARMYGYNHATIIYAVKLVENLMETDVLFSKKAESAKENIKKMLKL